MKIINPVPISRLRTAPIESEITVQLTADQEVSLSVTGQDAYGNPVNIGGDTAWLSSDETIIQIRPGAEPTSCTAVAVGPAGTASVTCTNDVDRDGTGDFMGSLAIDVVAGDVAEITVNPGTPTDKTPDRADRAADEGVDRPQRQE